MRRILAITSAALVAVPLAIGTVGAAEAAPTRAADGSPQIGGDENPLSKTKKDKQERRERGSSVAGIGPGDNPFEEGQDSVPDTNGFSTEDGPVDTNGDGPLDTNGIDTGDDD